MINYGCKYLIRNAERKISSRTDIILRQSLRGFNTVTGNAFEMQDRLFAEMTYDKLKSNPAFSLSLLNIKDIYYLQGKSDFKMEINKIIKVIDEKRKRQFDMDLETDILYNQIMNITNNKYIYDLIDQNVQYFTEYFKDANKEFRLMKSGSTITKSLLLAYIFYYRLNGENHLELYQELQKFIFRFQRFVLSPTHHYHSMVFKQQHQLAKQDSQQAATNKELHPLKMISKFLFQTIWLETGGESILGERTWPQNINFKIQDIVRLFETLSYDFEESLMEMYLDIFLKLEESQFIVDDQGHHAVIVDEVKRFKMLMDLLENVSEIILQGYSNKQIRILSKYLINQMLIELARVNDFNMIIKLLSLLHNTIVNRTVDDHLLMQLIQDSVYHLFKTSIPKSGAKVDKFDVIRILQYCENQELIDQVFEKIKQYNLLEQDIDIALYAKISQDMILDFKMEDKRLNSKIKRMIIRNDGMKEFLESSAVLQFMRDLKNTQDSLIEQLKRTVFKKSESQTVDFSKLSKKEDDVQFEENLQDIDEALETFCLILYSCSNLDINDLDKFPKLGLSIHLIYDILNVIIYKVDPWFVEEIIFKFNEKGLLKERLGATGESLYELTEEFVISNWGMFSDQFRHLYRHSLAEE